MRLTLRTLLAYRDRVLSADDMVDLHQRIQQSEDANRLLKRLSDVASKIPTNEKRHLDERKPEADANVVAEYLDGSLSGPHILELEKACLESDLRLGELAQCHEMIASAWNQQVSVPESLRSKALAIGDVNKRPEIEASLLTRSAAKRSQQGMEREDPAHLAAMQDGSQGNAENETAVGMDSPMMASASGAIREEGLNLESAKLAHEVPEYLVGAQQYRWRVPVAICGFAIAFAAILWMAIPWSEKLQELFVESSSSENTELSERPVLSDGRKSNVTPPAAIKNAPKTSVSTSPPPTRDSNSSTQSEEVDVERTADGTGSQKAVGSESIEAEKGSLDLDQTDTPEASPAAPPPQQQDAVNPVDVGSGDLDAEAESSSEMLKPSSDATERSGPFGTSLEQLLWMPNEDESQPDLAIIRKNGESVTLNSETKVDQGSELLVPPNMRPEFFMPNETLLTASGPSLIEVVSASAERVAVKSRLCRLLLHIDSTEHEELPKPTEISTPLGALQVRFLSRPATASIEVSYRPQKHGAVTDTACYVPVVVVICGEGKVEVASAGIDSSAVQFGIGEGVSIAGTEKLSSFRLQQIPTWFRPDSVRAIDRLAAMDIEQQIAGAPATDAMQELDALVKLNRPEVVAAAVQTQLLAGNWSSVVPSVLGQVDARAHWDQVLDLVRQLLASEPDEAKEFQRVLKSQLGAEAESLFGLVAGDNFDTAIAMQDSDRLSKLVGYLENSRLIYRVVANYQLQRLTGQASGFLPQSPAKGTIQGIRREISAGRMGLKSLPDLVWEQSSRSEQ